MAEIICIGQTLVDCIFRGWTEKSRLISAIGLQLGGDAFNKAVMMARLGHKVSLRAGVGDDFAGHALLDAAKNEGIDIDGCIVSRDHPTPVSALFVNDDGSRTSTLSKAHRIPFFTPSLAGAEGASALVVSSLFRPPFEDAEALARIAADAKTAGMAVYADVKIPKERKFTLAEFLNALKNVDYIFPNEEEAEYYSGEKDPWKAGEAFLCAGVRNIVLKLGARGAVHMGENGEFKIPAWDAPVADGVGAGDAFAAGFVCALLEGKSARDAALFASVCSAICIGAPGAISGLKCRSQVEEWLKAPPVSQRPMDI